MQLIKTKLIVSIEVQNLSEMSDIDVHVPREYIR